MGSFYGHILPGSFFVVFSLWWTVAMFRRYFTTVMTTSRLRPPTAAAKFRSSVTFPMTELFGAEGRGRWVSVRRWEWEGFFKVFFAIIGFFGEVFAATEHFHDRFSHIGNGQHATMFFAFGTSLNCSASCLALRVLSGVASV